MNPVNRTSCETNAQTPQRHILLKPHTVEETAWVMISRYFKPNSCKENVTFLAVVSFDAACSHTA